MPANPPSILQRVLDLLNNATVAAIIALLVGALGVLLVQWFSHRRLTIWACWHWRLARIGYTMRRIFRRHKPLVTCIDEYVYILDSLRNRLVKRCEHIRGKPTDPLPQIIVCVYTRQLPSDWPLWGKSIDVTTSPQTALEEYVRGFHKFLNEANDLRYDVQVNRVIVIDNGRTNRGIEKCKRLIEDCNSGTPFDTYMKFLHGPKTDSAQVFWTERPWPGWLSDAVIYGIKEPGKTLRWLWGVTTSYDAGEDLILLRLHRTLNRTFDGNFHSGALRLPEGVETLRDLAARAQVHPLAKKLQGLPKTWEPWK